MYSHFVPFVSFHLENSSWFEVAEYFSNSVWINDRLLEIVDFLLHSQIV